MVDSPIKPIARLGTPSRSPEASRASVSEDAAATTGFSLLGSPSDEELDLDPDPCLLETVWNDHKILQGIDADWPVDGTDTPQSSSLEISSVADPSSVVDASVESLESVQSIADVFAASFLNDFDPPLCHRAEVLPGYDIADPLRSLLLAVDDRRGVDEALEVGENGDGVPQGVLAGSGSEGTLGRVSNSASTSSTYRDGSLATSSPSRESSRRDLNTPPFPPHDRVPSLIHELVHELAKQENNEDGACVKTQVGSASFHSAESNLGATGDDAQSALPATTRSGISTASSGKDEGKKRPRPDSSTDGEGFIRQANKLHASELEMLLRPKAVASFLENAPMATSTPCVDVTSLASGSTANGMQSDIPSNDNGEDAFHDQMDNDSGSVITNGAALNDPLLVPSARVDPGWNETSGPLAHTRRRQGSLDRSFLIDQVLNSDSAYRSHPLYELLHDLHVTLKSFREDPRNKMHRMLVSLWPGDLNKMIYYFFENHPERKREFVERHTNLNQLPFLDHRSEGQETFKHNVYTPSVELAFLRALQAVFDELQQLVNQTSIDDRTDST